MGGAGLAVHVVYTLYIDGVTGSCVTVKVTEPALLQSVARRYTTDYVSSY